MRTLACSVVVLLSAGCLEGADGPSTSPLWRVVEEVADAGQDLHGPPTWSTDGETLYGVTWRYEEERFSDDLVYGYRERRRHTSMVFVFDPVTDAREPLLPAPIEGQPLRLHSVGEVGFVLQVVRGEPLESVWVYASRSGRVSDLLTAPADSPIALDLLPSADGQVMAQVSCELPEVMQDPLGAWVSDGPARCEVRFLETETGAVLGAETSVVLGFEQDASHEAWQMRGGGLATWTDDDELVVTNWDDEAIRVGMDGEVAPVDVPCLGAPRTASSRVSGDGVYASVVGGVLQLEDGRALGHQAFGCH